MKFSDWTKLRKSHIIDNAAGDSYDGLSDTAKECIDGAVERFMKSILSDDERVLEKAQRCSTSKLSEREKILIKATLKLLV
jgi:histone H3/H4